MCLTTQDLNCITFANWLARNLSRELALVVASQTISSTSSDEVHALAMSGPYKQNQQSLSMIMLHCHTMPLKDEALQHLWQILKLFLTLII
jgi:hypothetical protein